MQQTDTQHEDSTLDRKLQDLVPDRIVLKPLTRWNEAYKEFPRYVMEYLCARYVQPNDPVPGQTRIDKLLNEHYTDSTQRELIRSKVREAGHYTLLGELKVRLDERRDHYWADIPALGSNTVRVSPVVLKDWQDLLLGPGAWGSMEIEYDASYVLKNNIYPFYLRDFRPFQITKISLEDYIVKRSAFTDDEWRDLLLESIGFNPDFFDEREAWLYLMRLVPFVETNYNLIELGPRETGKTYTYRNTSSRSFVISGGSASPATLFYNVATRKIGILGQKDVVYFDEIGNTRFADPETTTSVLKDYMQTGRFTRGPAEFSTHASIVLGGNIDSDSTNRLPAGHYAHLFMPLPVELQDDPAFLDRIHAFLPGWELPKIRRQNYAEGYGLMTDYLAEIFTRLRRRNFQTHVAKWVRFKAMTSRNQDAIAKSSAGLMKLLYPHRTPDTILRSEILPCLDLAVECRQRVVDQLRVMRPSEFAGPPLKDQLEVIA
jgi:ATP-dependent Lon protease